MDILFLVCLILLNGLFALSELAIVSAKAPRLRGMADRGDRGAKAALALLADPSRLLSTVQIGITLIGIVAGAYGATAIADDLSPLIATAAPSLAGWAEDIAFGIVIVGTTYLSLVLGELLPKRIALAAPERLACIVAPPMARLASFSGPFVWLLKSSTEALLRLLGLHGAPKSNVTADEIHAVLEEGHSAGLIEPEEREMITGIMRLGDRTVRAIMTPRTEIVWLDPARPIEDNLALIESSGHTRFPVASGDIDHVIGVVQTKDMIVRPDRGADLRAAMHPLCVAPETLPVGRVLDVMREKRVRMLLVVDEHGVVQGLVTAADVLESIVGDVALSAEEAIDPVVPRADGSWLIDGMMPVDEIEQLARTTGLLTSGAYDTAAGLVVHELQQMPFVGARVSVGPLEFEVVDIDGRRIDKIMVRRTDVIASG